MGKDFRDGLTKSGVQDNGQTTFYNSPGQAAVQAAKLTTAPTYVAQNQDLIPQVTGYTQPRPILPGQPEFQSAAAPPTTETYVQGSAGNTPNIVKPSFQDATTDRAGNATLGNGLTKGGVLFGLIKAGLQGGMDAAAGGALDAVPGRSAFGAGFGAADHEHRVREQEFNRQRNLDEESAQRQQQIAQGPVLFNAKVAADQADAVEKRSRAKFLDAQTTNKGKTISDLASEAVALGYTPGSAEYNQHVFGKPLQEPVIKTDAQLRYEAANGNEAAKAAIADHKQERKDLQRPLKGSSSKADKVLLNQQAEQATAAYLQQSGNDPNKAAQMLEEHLPAAAAQDPRAYDIATEVRKKLKAQKGLMPKSKSATPTFLNSTPTPAN